MPIKYFCDVCGVEVSDPSMSLDMTGKILCSKHYQEHESLPKPVYKITHEPLQKKSKPYPFWIKFPRDK